MGYIAHLINFARNKQSNDYTSRLVKIYYYTSEEFFLYKTTVDKWTIQHFTLEMNY